MFEYKFSVYTIGRVWTLSACSTVITKLVICIDKEVPKRQRTLITSNIVCTLSHLWIWHWWLENYYMFSWLNCQPDLLLIFVEWSYTEDKHSPYIVFEEIKVSRIKWNLTWCLQCVTSEVVMFRTLGTLVYV